MDSIFDQMARVRMKLPEIAPQLFHIRTKDRGIIPFELSEAQKRLVLGDNVGSDIVLKARQLGISTLTVIEFLAYVLFIEGFNGVIVSEDRDKTKKLLRIAHLAYSMLPDKYKIPRDHSREDYIVTKAPNEGGKGSSLYVGTAGSAHFGRGDTIHAAHCSELGLWEEAKELLNGLEESVPFKKGAILRIESTAYGYGNHFWQLCDRAMNKRGGRYNFHFFPWWYSLDDEYKLPLDDNETIVFTDKENELVENVWEQYQFQLNEEHIKWRRAKIDAKGEDNFRQEYPEDPKTCFLTTGNAVFYGIKDMLVNTMERLRNRQPLIIESEEGVEVKYWKFSKPQSTYILTLDTSEGTQEASAFDAFTIWEIRDDTIEQCITAKGRVAAAKLTQVMIRLSRDYNDCMMAVERANKGFSVLDMLIESRDRYNYDLYEHEEFDNESGKRRRTPGWRPTRASKAAAIGNFETMFRAGELIIHDVELAEQAVAYIYDPKSGKARPPEGGFSDILTTAYMAAYCYEDARTEGNYGVKDVI